MQKSVLPTVKPETCFSIETIFSRDEDETFVLRYLEEIKKTNPMVGLWIERFSNKSDDPLMTSACATVVYKMLESQLEAERLNTLFQ